MSGSPSPDVRARILAEARRTPAPTTADRRRGSIIAVTAAAIASLALWMWLGPLASNRAPNALAVLGVACFAAAFSATWLAASRGRSTVGRSSRALAAVIVLAPVALLAAATAIAAWEGVVVAGGGTSLRQLPCAAYMLLFALPPFVALLYARRHTDPVHPRLLGAALGAASGAWGGAMISLQCELASVAHMAIGHALPILVAAMSRGRELAVTRLRRRRRAPRELPPLAAHVHPIHAWHERSTSTRGRRPTDTKPPSRSKSSSSRIA